MIDETHDKARQSWVASANGHAEFPLQNLPFGVFSPPGRTAPDAAPRGGIAIGDMIFDLRAAHDAGLFSGAAAAAAQAASGGILNPLIALGAGPRCALRQQVFALLAADGAGRAKLEPLADKLLHRASDCWLHLPAAIGNFTDFFAGIHHARNGGRRRDPNNPLSSNYKYVPVAYHSRASSLRESGLAVRRPAGQRVLPNETAPSYGPCRNLDYELELAVWVGVVGAGRAPGGGSRSRLAKQASTSSASASSMTGRRATSSSGKCRRSVRSSARISAARSRPGSSPPRRLNRSASRSQSGPPAIRAPWTICGTRTTSARAPSTSSSKRSYSRRKCARRRSNPIACRAATRSICIGPWRSSSRITPAAAAICCPATFLVAAQSRDRPRKVGEALTS